MPCLPAIAWAPQFLAAGEDRWVSIVFLIAYVLFHIIKAVLRKNEPETPAESHDEAQEWEDDRVDDRVDAPAERPAPPPPRPVLPPQPAPLPPAPVRPAAPPVVPWPVAESTSPAFEDGESFKRTEVRLKLQELRAAITDLERRVAAVLDQARGPAFVVVRSVTTRVTRPTLHAIRDRLPAIAASVEDQAATALRRTAEAAAQTQALADGLGAIERVVRYRATVPHGPQLAYADAFIQLLLGDTVRGQGRSLLVIEGSADDPELPAALLRSVGFVPVFAPPGFLRDVRLWPALVRDFVARSAPRTSLRAQVMLGPNDDPVLPRSATTLTHQAVLDVLRIYYPDAYADAACAAFMGPGYLVHLAALLTNTYDHEAVARVTTTDGVHPDPTPPAIVRMYLTRTALTALGFGDRADAIYTEWLERHGNPSHVSLPSRDGQTLGVPVAPFLDITHELWRVLSASQSQWYGLPRWSGRPLRYAVPDEADGARAQRALLGDGALPELPAHVLLGLAVEAGAMNLAQSTTLGLKLARKLAERHPRLLSAGRPAADDDALDFTPTPALLVDAVLLHGVFRER